MISGSEMKALKTVNREQGMTTTRLISRQLGIDPSYARVLCANLIKSEHLDQENRGCFRITVKGKQALGWPHEEELLDAKQAMTPFKKIQREEFQWQSFRSVGIKNNAAGFFKPGQDEVGWSTMQYGNTIRSRQANPGRPPSLMKEKTHSCVFCGGTEKKEKGAACSVCRGTGSVQVTPPAVSCAYCRGKGIERRTGRICGVCRGKGVVPVRTPIATCGKCRGTGAEQGSRLTCLKCGGKGVVHVRKITGNAHNGGNRRDN